MLGQTVQPTSGASGGLSAARELQAPLVAQAKPPIRLEALQPEGLALTKAGRTLRISSGGQAQPGACEIILRPDHGATISALRFGRPDRIDLTAWTPERWSGLLQEQHTADRAYVAEWEETGGATALDGARGAGIVLTCTGGDGELSVSKRITFRRGVPFLHVEWVFKNEGPYALSGAQAPAVSSLVLPAGGATVRGARSSGREYYCLDRGRGAETMTPGRALQELNPVRAPEGPLRWMAVTDPAGLKGLGFVFLDDAAHSPWARKDPDGRVLIGWRYRSVPPHHTLRTEMLVVPLEGLAAVSGLGGAFAADTSFAGGSRTARVNIMALAEPLSNVSVVTRAYATDGRELDPCDTLIFPRIDPYRPESGRIDLPGGEGQVKAVWLRHEVYSSGGRVGSYTVPVTPPAGAVPVPVRSLPSAGVERWRTPSNSPDVSGAGRSFALRLLGSEGELGLPERLTIDLTAGEKETLFFGFEARKAIGGVVASVVADTRGAQRGVEPLHPAAAFLWSVEPGPGGADIMRPLTQRRAIAGKRLWLALTLDAGPLAPGAHAARLFVEADGESVEVPIQVSVSALRVRPREGFALWYVDVGSPSGPISAGEVSKLASYTVSALGRPTQAPSLIRQARAGGMDMAGFYAPGAGTAAAEQSGVSPDVLCEPLMAAGPAWLLWSGSDDLQAAERLRSLGYVPALGLQGLSALPGAAAGEGPRLVLVDGGCEPGEVAGFVRAGLLRVDDAVWLWLDLQGADWRDAAVRVRSAVWAAAWQGLDGVAVRAARPQKEADRQFAIWHVLRDAREEAALLALAMGRSSLATSLSLQGPQGHGPRVRLAAALLALQTVVNADRADLTIRMQTRRVPFRQVLRAEPNGTGGLAPLEAFAAARNVVQEAWQEIKALPGMRRPWPNAFWRGVPLLEDGVVRWSIVALGEKTTGVRARKLQSLLHDLTGRQVPIVYARATLESAGVEQGPRLIWLMTDQLDPDKLPPVVRTAVLAAGPGRPGAARLKDGVWAVVLGPDSRLQSLVATLSPGPTLWRSAGGLR